MGINGQVSLDSAELLLAHDCEISGPLRRTSTGGLVRCDELSRELGGCRFLLETNIDGDPYGKNVTLQFGSCAQKGRPHP